jgi:hypothetical protein
MPLTKCTECNSPILSTAAFCPQCDATMAGVVNTDNPLTNTQNTSNSYNKSVVFGVFYALSVLIYLAALIWLIWTIISISHGNASNEAIVMPGTITFISITCCSITGLLILGPIKKPVGLFAFYLLSGQLFWSGLIWLICTIILTSHGNLSNGTIIMPIITTIVGILCNLCGGILLMLRD